MRRCTLLIALIMALAVGCAGDVRLTRTPIRLPLSPEEVVTLFNRTYGTAQMDDIGPYTTARFRKGRPVTVWTVDMWGRIEEAGQERIDFKIRESWTHEDGDYATVVTHTRIAARTGTTRLKEVFILLLEGGAWKIDDLYVTDLPEPEPDKKS